MQGNYISKDALIQAMYEVFKLRIKCTADDKAIASIALMAIDMIDLVSAMKTVTKILEESNTSKCGTCKHMNLEYGDYRCIDCGYAYFNHYEPMEKGDNE